MSAQHTPGTWEVDEMLTVNAPSTLMVAECSCAAVRPSWGGTDYSTRAHQEANARLIAAAPELLALLRESRGDLAVAAACWSDDDDPAVAVFHRARVLNLVCSIDAAIAKVQP